MKKEKKIKKEEKAIDNIGKVVYLGKNDNAENWQEVTDFQAELLQEQAGQVNGE